MKLCTSISASFAALLFLVLPVRASATILDRTVVTVNDDVILESDIDKFIRKARSKSFQELFGGIDEKTIADRQKVLQLLVEEKLIDQQVKKLELQATPQEVDGQIRAIVKRNGITQAQLVERLKQLGTSMDDYRDGLKRQIERRNLVEREIKPSLEVTDEDLRHFYQRNQKANDADVQYKIAHILIENRTKGGLSAEVRAKKIYQEVSQHPESFDKFVKEYSDDQSTADAGGVLGYFSASALSKEFRNIVPKTAPGRVTAPIRTRAGYHIVKVVEAQAANFSTLSKEQKEALRNQMASQEMEKKMALWLERKKSEAHIMLSPELTTAEKSTTSPEK